MAYRSPLSTFSLQVFPSSYQQGCQLWRIACDQLPIGNLQRDFNLPGGETESLVCQTAWIGPQDAVSILVVIAGTHGVEGFTGTAVQCDLFQQLAGGCLWLPEDTAILAINALNPWGYAHRRRCDSQGIDVNRNFVDFSAQLPANPGYEELRPLLFLPNHHRRREALANAALAMGQRQYEIAFSGGQFTDCHGPFYGGSGPGFSRGVIETLIADHQLGRRRLAVVDVHTGLGSYGYGEVICDHPLDSPGTTTARRWYGNSCTLPAAGTSSSVPKLGLLDYAWHQVMGADSCFVTLEFGTLGTDSLFEVLLDDACYWRHNQPGANAVDGEIAQRMLAHFYPEDNYWREAVIFRSRQVLQQALLGVSGQ